jgi:hypothetical protein
LEEFLIGEICDARAVRGWQRLGGFQFIRILDGCAQWSGLLNLVGTLRAGELIGALYAGVLIGSL